MEKSRESLTQLEKRVDKTIDRLAFVSFEFGFKCAENGMNLEQASAEYIKLMLLDSKPKKKAPHCAALERPKRGANRSELSG